MSTGKAYTGKQSLEQEGLDVERQAARTTNSLGTCAEKRSEEAAGEEQEQHVNSFHIETLTETLGRKNTIRQTFMKRLSARKDWAMV